MSRSSIEDDAATSSVLARGLVDPAFAKALRGGKLPKSPAHRRAARDVDAERLALFAGFITKVRYNNDLFDHLPETLRLLRRRGVEMVAFRDYYLSGVSRSKNPEDKVAAAADHFARFAASAVGRKVTGLPDVLAHERANWELRLELLRWRTVAGPPDVPFLTGPYRIIRTTWDPWLVIEAGAAARRPARTARHPATRLYWARPFEREIRSAVVDARTASVVAAVDGRRDLSTIAAQMRDRRISPQAVFAIMVSLVQAGVIDVVRDSP